jgi:hypothetical protein
VRRNHLELTAQTASAAGGVVNSAGGKENLRKYHHAQQK